VILVARQQAAHMSSAAKIIDKPQNNCQNNGIEYAASYDKQKSHRCLNNDGFMVL